jgi:sec-independent protein translocase protein TatA
LDSGCGALDGRNHRDKRRCSVPFRLGPVELIIILAIIIFVFGAGKLPQLGGALGKGIRQFRKGVSDGAQGDAEMVAELGAKSRNSLRVED